MTSTRSHSDITYEPPLKREKMVPLTPKKVSRSRARKSAILNDYCGKSVGNSVVYDLVVPESKASSVMSELRGDTNDE